MREKKIIHENERVTSASSGTLSTTETSVETTLLSTPLDTHNGITHVERYMCVAPPTGESGALGRLTGLARTASATKTKRERGRVTARGAP